MNPPLKKLTLGILTYNNPTGLQSQVESILSNIKRNPELEEDVEILISDNSENKETQSIVHSLFQNIPYLIYIKNEKNIGFDRNVDKVLTVAQGSFCWTLSDNDNIIDGGIKAVISFIEEHKEISHIIIDTTGIERRVRVFKNTESLLKERGNTSFIGGLVSQNIFNKNFLPPNRSSYYDNQWFHLSVALEVGFNNPIALIPNILEQKKANEECRWAENGHTFTTYVNLDTIAMNLTTIGYSQDFFQEYHRAFVKGLPHQVVSGKLYGLKNTKENRRELYRHAYKEKSILGLCLFFLAVPVPIFKVARSLWKKL